MLDYEVDVSCTESDLWDDLTPLLVRGDLPSVPLPQKPVIESDRNLWSRPSIHSRKLANAGSDSYQPVRNQRDLREAFALAREELNQVLAEAESANRLYDPRLGGQEYRQRRYKPRTNPQVRAELRGYIAHLVQWLLSKCPAPYTVAELNVVLEFGRILRAQTGTCLGLKASSLFHHACAASSLPELGLKAILDRVHTGMDYSLPICQALMMSLYDKMSAPLPTLLSSLFIDPIPQIDEEKRTKWPSFTQAQLAAAEASPLCGKASVALLTAVYRARYQIWLRMRLLALVSSLSTGRVMDAMLLACIVGSAMRFLHLEPLLSRERGLPSVVLDSDMLKSLDETFTLLATSLDAERSVHAALGQLRKTPSYEQHKMEALDPNVVFFTLHAKPYGVEWLREAARYYALRRSPFLPTKIAADGERQPGPFLPDDAPAVSITLTTYFNSVLRSRPAFSAAKDLRSLFTQVGLLDLTRRQQEKERRSAQTAPPVQSKAKHRHKARREAKATARQAPLGAASPSGSKVPPTAKSTCNHTATQERLDTISSQISIDAKCADTGHRAESTTGADATCAEKLPHLSPHSAHSPQHNLPLSCSARPTLHDADVLSSSSPRRSRGRPKKKALHAPEAQLVIPVMYPAVPPVEESQRKCPRSRRRVKSPVLDFNI